MTDAVFSDEMKQKMSVEQVSALALALLHPNADETGAVIETGGGWAGKMVWSRSKGIGFKQADYEAFLKNWSALSDPATGSDYPVSTHDSLSAALSPHKRGVTLADSSSPKRSAAT